MRDLLSFEVPDNATLTPEPRGVDLVQAGLVGEAAYLAQIDLFFNTEGLAHEYAAVSTAEADTATDH